MKLGVYVGDAYKQETRAGGGDVFLNSILDSIEFLQKEHEVILLTSQKGATLPCPSLYLAPALFRKYKLTINLFSNIKAKIKRRLFWDLYKSIAEVNYFDYDYYALNALLLANGVELLYFPTPHFFPSKLPYIITVWDLAHKNYPFFPEVNYSGQSWISRQLAYQASLSKAAYVVTGTQRGKQEIIKYYNIAEERVVVFPFPVPSYLEANRLWEKKSSSLLKNKEPYIFYPAQFWPHKNHANLLLGLKELEEKFKLKLNLVLTGGDKGNRSHIEELINRYELNDSVSILGFVSQEKIIALYQNALCMVFPSFFGPDNLPPLEAFALGCPVLASHIPGAEEQLKDACLFFDPLSPEDIARTIKQIYTDHNLRIKLIQKGKSLAKYRSVKIYMTQLNELISSFNSYRINWSSAEEYVHL